MRFLLCLQRCHELCAQSTLETHAHTCGDVERGCKRSLSSVVPYKKTHFNVQCLLQAWHSRFITCQVLFVVAIADFADERAQEVFVLQAVHYRREHELWQDVFKYRQELRTAILKRETVYSPK